MGTRRTTTGEDAARTTAPARRADERLDEAKLFALVKKRAAKVVIKLLDSDDPWVALESAKLILGLR